MPERTNADSAPIKPGLIGTIAVYLIFGAVLLRTFGIKDIGFLLPRFLGVEFAFIFLFSLFLWRYTLPGWLLHIYFALQSLLIFTLLSLWPDFDFIIVFYIMLSYQVSLVFSGKTRWVWCGLFILFMGGSLVLYHGILRGLALSLTSMAACVILPAFIRANHEIQQAQAESQVLLSELQSAHDQLEVYSKQADELASMKERIRLARELHDTVSQMIFSISLTTRSIQLLLEKNPSRLFEQLQRLQEITANALGQLRSLITQLRPPQES